MKPVVQRGIRRGSGVNEEVSDYAWENSGSPGFLCPQWSWGTSSPWGTKWTNSKEMFVFRRTSLGLHWDIDHVHGDGFGTPFRLDRKAEVMRKTQGGGVCLYSNKQYCSSLTVREHICTPDVKLLSVSLRPFYLPREFKQIFVTTVYIHPKANVTSAVVALLSKTVLQAVSLIWCTKLHTGWL